MPAPFRLWENAQIVSLLAPAADAAGRTSGYVTTKFGAKAFVVCMVNQGNAAQVTFSVLQATDNLGSNSTAIGSGPIAVNLNTGSSDQYSFPAAAASYQTDAGTNNKIVIFEVQPEEVLNVNNLSGGNPLPFNHVAVETSASNVANITAAYLVVMPLRDQRQNPPTTTGV